jgi:CRISPR/Cas system-associated exonuclease Cas4 (RecB family)
MLCGKAVHEFIVNMIRKRPEGRKFYYKTLDSALGGWIYKWRSTLLQKGAFLLEPNKSEEWKFKAIGSTCISNYWAANISKPDPLKLEDRKRINLFAGMDLVAVADQIRAVNPDVIARYRPDLMSGGQLHPDYNPEVIIDLKTTLTDFDKKQETSDLAKAGSQHHLASSIQATAYTRAYRQFNGKWPIGFFFYMLYRNQFFFVSADDDEKQVELDNHVHHLLRNLKDESFPKASDPIKCRYCGYLKECVGEKGVVISIGTDSPNGPDVRRIFSRERFNRQPKQLKLPFLK